MGETAENIYEMSCAGQIAGGAITREEQDRFALQSQRRAVSAINNGWLPADRPRRLRLACDTYGFDAVGRHEVLGLLGASIDRGGEFVRRRAEAGEPGFVKMWAEIGGKERFDRRRRWWADARAEFESVLR